MMLYKQWVNIAIYPLEPDHIQSREQRLSTENLMDAFGDDYHPGEPGFLTLSPMLLENEQFEAMEIDDYGHVIIWTNKRVLSILQDRGIEKVWALPRNFSQV